jgi:hypothetical protein
MTQDSPPARIELIGTRLTARTFVKVLARNHANPLITSTLKSERRVRGS